MATEGYVLQKLRERLQACSQISPYMPNPQKGKFERTRLRGDDQPKWVMEVKPTPKCKITKIMSLDPARAFAIGGYLASITYIDDKAGTIWVEAVKDTTGKVVRSKTTPNELQPPDLLHKRINLLRDRLSQTIQEARKSNRLDRPVQILCAASDLLGQALVNIPDRKE